MREKVDVATEARAVVEEDVYESAKLKELGWSRSARRVRPLKGWFGLAHESNILTNKVDVDGTRRILERVREVGSPSVAEE